MNEDLEYTARNEWGIPILPSPVPWPPDLHPNAYRLDCAQGLPTWLKVSAGVAVGLYLLWRKRTHA